MKEVIFKLAMVVSLLMSFGTAFADGNQETNPPSVRILVYKGEVLAGNSYVAEAAVTVYFKDGTSYLERYSGVTIDYGMSDKKFGWSGKQMIEYKSDCRNLEGDVTFMNIVAQGYGGSNVKFILIEVKAEQA